MIRRPLVLLLLLPALGVAAGAAGCGDDDDGGGSATARQTSTTANRAYQTQVQAILGTVGTAGRELGRSVSSNLSQVADALDTFQGQVKTAADKLGDLDAPPAAAQGQDELEQVLREIADGVQESIDAARSGDRAKFTRAFRAYQAKLDGEFRRRLTAAGAKIDQALRSP